jgi:hypothetical protein
MIFTIGPLTPLVVWVIDGKGLAYNTGFLPSKAMFNSFFIQYIMWGINMFFVIMWIFSTLPKDHPFHGQLVLNYIYPEQLLFFELQVVIRSFIIAVRYAYCSELRFSLLKHGAQEVAFISKDLLFYSWLILDPTNGLWEEIQSSLWRNQVEEALFKISIIETMDRDTYRRLTDSDYYKDHPYDSKARHKEI